MQRVAALNGVLSKLIEFLRTRITDSEACPYRSALNQVIDIANPSDYERNRISFAQNSANWPDLPVLLRRLAEKYSAMLAVSVEGQTEADFLLWRGADFTHTFANEEPDAEHLCICILALEGVASDLVSANWDGLIEAAVSDLGYAAVDIFRICVTGNDFRGPAAAAKLMKFHGCAVRAIENEAVYRPLLIARWPQIVGWAENNMFAAMKHALVGVAAQRKTLMIGMSAQDPNIQTLFQGAQALATWPWNDDPPAHVFAEQSLGVGQRTILEISYGNDFHAHQPEILSRSCIQAYAKPLLTALVLNVIASKCRAMLRSVSAPRLQEPDFTELDRGINRIRNLAANAAGTDILPFVKHLVRHTSRVKAMLQEGQHSIAAQQPYRPINSRHAVDNDPNLGVTGQREAASGLALFGLGEESGDWSLTLGDLLNNEAGAIRVSSPAGKARVIFVANSNVDLNLFNDGVYKEDDGEVILVHSSLVVARQQRSPSRQMGRKGKKSAVHVDLSSILESASSVVDLRARFRQEIGL